MGQKERTKTQSISRLAAVAVTALMCSGEAGASPEAPSCENAAIQQIERYCSKSWRTAHIPRDEWNDSTQQVLAELLERIPRQRLAGAIDESASQERRELNRSIWRIAKRWVRRQRHASIENCEETVAMPVHENPEADDKIEQVLRIAATKLSDRQHQIISMLKQGHSVAEIAQTMNLPASRISNEKHRAIKQIRRYLCDAA